MKMFSKQAVIMALKYVLPSVLASVGTAVAIAYPVGYSAFCGVT